MEKKILKLDHDAKTEIRAFEMTNLNGGDAPVFRTPTLAARAKGSLKINTDENAPRKDRRFHVDPALQSLLAVDDETDKEIEARVELRLRELSAGVEEAARERGYSEGYARGKAEATQTFEATSLEKIEKVDHLILGFETLKMEVYQANERFLVELLQKIVGVILEKEINADAEYLCRVVRTVVEKVGVKEQLKLIANSEQIETLYSLLPELEKKYSGLKNISIESSSALTTHDVVIETDWNRIDATLETQLGSLRETVLSALEQSQRLKAQAPDAS